MNRQELSAASSIGLLYLIRMLGLFMVLPVLPLVAPEISGATPLLVGLAIGIYGLSQGILQIPFGLLSDVYGRKLIIAMGLILFIAGSFLAATAQDIYWLILGRFLQGCGAIASSLLALMSDLTRVDQRSKSMAIIGIAIGGSFGLSLILGPVIWSSYGLAGLFYVTGALGVVGLVFLVAFIPTPNVLANNLDASVQQSRLSEVLLDPGLWRVNLSVFVLHYLLISAFSVFPLLLRATGEIEDNEHSLYYLVLLAGSFVLMLPLMWLADRLRDSRPIVLVMVALAFLAFGILLFPGYWFVILAMVLFFMAFNLLEVLLPAQLSRLAGAGFRGTAMGVYSSFQFFGIFFGGSVSGLVLTMGDISDLMYVNMVICALWFLLTISFPQVGNVGSRTIVLGDLRQEYAQDGVDALLSVHGVIDAAIIESDGVAYLKVDEDRFDDRLLKNITDT